MRIIGRNIFSLGLSRITSGVVLFFVQAKLASYLGPHSFGKFSLVLALQTIFLLFVDLGISRYAIKKISEDKTTASHYYGNFLIAQLFLALIVFALFTFIPRIFNYDAEITQAMLLVGAGLLLTAMSIPSLAIIQAWQKIHIFATLIFIESLMKAVWFVYAILNNKNLVFIFIVYVLVGIFDILAYWIVTRKIAVPKFRFEISTIRAMLTFGLPFAMISGFEMLIAKIDIVIQKVFLPFSEIGLYSAAYRFLDFLTFLPAIVAISLFPYFAEQKDMAHEDVKTIADRLNRYMFSLALPIAFGLSLFARPLILYLFGPEYYRSILILQILIWATALTIIYAVPNTIMVLKKTRHAVLVLVGVTVLNAGLNIALVPRYGILASAWITLLSYLVIGAVYTFLSRKVVPFRMFRFVTRDDVLALKSFIRSEK